MEICCRLQSSTFHLSHSGCHALRPRESDACGLKSTPVKVRNMGHRGCGHVSTRHQVVCLAAPTRRTKMMAQQLKREIGDILVKDSTLQRAMVPEAGLGADKYMTSVATVSEVVVSGDLQNARVYISVFGDERGQEMVMEGLKARQGYVRTLLGKRMRLRATPKLFFIRDDSLETSSRVLSLLDEIQQEKRKKDPSEDASSFIDEDEERGLSSRQTGGAKQRDSTDSDADEFGQDENIIFIR
eukprot:TRINITY_DN21633_c0_g1_i1.p1 TRINITY_DN21633_c0_g1~~TRINITY_DN21633_c0_g1_i1.p1  ORF type:complete len:242 (-),score=50.01 TRINITY_DN21633_c0_g1_i1:152-877(-)